MSAAAKPFLARQREGDVGTYHYGDNLARGVRYVARQLVDLIPKIYDTQRIARIIGEDGETKMVKINPDQPQPVNKIMDQQGIVIDKIYNPGVGKYDVVATTGPGYATKRQEALEAMANCCRVIPNCGKWPVTCLSRTWTGQVPKRWPSVLPRPLIPSSWQDGDKPPRVASC
jgi:hypothetical protein